MCWSLVIISLTSVDRSVSYQRHGSYSSCQSIVQEFICCYGTLEQIHADQGCNFEATLNKEICSLLEIQKTEQPRIINSQME